MLRACRCLLLPGGHLAFHTIHPAPGLSDRDYKRAIRIGPRAVSTRRLQYSEMLTRAGFDLVDIVDLTRDFAIAARALHQHQENSFAELARLRGRQAIADRQAVLVKVSKAIEDGLLERSLFVAQRR